MTKIIQTFNWLFAGSQRVGKTSKMLSVAAQLQFVAFCNKKVKRVLIYNPQKKNPIFEKKSSIQEKVRHTLPNWEFPAKFRVIKPQDIKTVFDDKRNYFDWCVVEEGDLKTFADNCVTVKDAIIIWDDLNNIVKGNLAGKRFESFLDIFAQNRIRCVENLISYHSFRQVPPALWLYFQRAIVLQTEDTPEGYNRIQNGQSLLIEAQIQVREQNRITKYPENLRLSERIVWLDQDYLFQKQGKDLITRIDGVYYRAVGSEIEEV